MGKTEKKNGGNERRGVKEERETEWENDGRNERMRRAEYRIKRG